MQSALKAMAAIQAVYHPTEQSLKKNLTSQVSLFKSNPILSSIQDDQFAFAMMDANRDGLVTAHRCLQIRGAHSGHGPGLQRLYLREHVWARQTCRRVFRADRHRRNRLNGCDLAHRAWVAIPAQAGRRP